MLAPDILIPDGFARLGLEAVEVAAMTYRIDVLAIDGGNAA